MKENSKFLSIISDYGFDIKKEFDITGSMNDGDLILTVITQGKREYYWQSDIRLAAIKHLIETLDIKHDMNGDLNLFEKYVLTILDAIGSVIKWNTPYSEERNIEIVKSFIEDALNSRILIEAEKEGLIDQSKDDID
ncbi:UNVERIFIED_CONTAM: hypothetical protein ABID98_004393 [Brevibacillus sp. OAP136]